MKDNKSKRISALYSDMNITKDFRYLLYDIFQYTNTDIFKIKFLDEISKIILNFFKCDVIEIWVREESKKNILKYQDKHTIHLVTIYCITTKLKMIKLI